jgi:integrase
VTLGTAENLDAQAARQRAKDVLSKVHLGDDPQTEKAERRAQASVTVGAMVELYLAERAAKRLKPRSFEEVERHLKKHWSALSGLPIRSVTRSDVAAQLGRIAKDSGPFASNKARAALSASFSWAIGEGLVDATPVLGTNKATGEISRDRVLSGEELAAIWKEAGGGDYGAIVRLRILTGQRREEVGGMPWSEIDLDKHVWRIDAERTKNGLAHEVPLSFAAVEILRKRERSGRALVFGSRKGPFQGWSNAKSALDRRVLTKLSEEGAMKPWRLHDIRRTVATCMADLGVQPHVIEAVLNHISGHKAGVGGVYNPNATWPSAHLLARERPPNPYDRYDSTPSRTDQIAANPRRRSSKADAADGRASFADSRRSLLRGGQRGWIPRQSRSISSRIRRASPSRLCFGSSRAGP